MTDVEVQKNTELMVAGLNGLTTLGEEFVDWVTTPRMVVVDAGRIIVHQDELAGVLLAAAAANLRVSVEDVTT